MREPTADDYRAMWKMEQEMRAQDRARIAELEQFKDTHEGIISRERTLMLGQAKRIAELEALLRRARWRISEDVFQDFTDEIDAYLGAENPSSHDEPEVTR